MKNSIHYFKSNLFFFQSLYFPNWKNLVIPLLTIVIVFLSGIGNSLYSTGTVTNVVTQSMFAVNKAVCCPPYGEPPTINIDCNSMVWSTYNTMTIHADNANAAIINFANALNLPGNGLPASQYYGVPDRVYITNEKGEPLKINGHTINMDLTLGNPNIVNSAMSASISILNFPLSTTHWIGYELSSPETITIDTIIKYRIVYVWSAPECRYINGYQYVGNSIPQTATFTSSMQMFNHDSIVLCTPILKCYGDKGDVKVQDKCSYLPTTPSFGNNTNWYILYGGVISPDTNTTGIFNNIGAGTYTLNIVDSLLLNPVATQIFTIAQPNLIIDTISHIACDTYTWMGNLYTASGFYTFSDTASNGCDSLSVLNLTINISTTSSLSATACDTYTWAANGTTYTSSGTYTATSLNAAGCTHTETLTLTINNSTSNTTTVTTTGSYTWAVNSVTYFASGTYSATSLNAAGCTHTETLILTISGTVCPYTLSVIEDQPISCNGNTDASCLATATPAGSYTYTIVSPDATTSTNTTGFFDNLVTGTHTVYATDGTCISSQTIYFMEPAPLSITFTTDSLVSCHGNDGQLSVNITGGTNVLQGYLTWWTNAAGDTLNDVLTDNFALTLSNLPDGPYNVAIEDDHGCFFNATGNIGVAAPIVVTANYAQIVCKNGTTSINPATTGGVPYTSYTYTVNGLVLANPYSAGTYTVVATDAKGCTGSSVITISNPANITGTSSVTACDTYTLAGTTYSTSGAYVHTFTAANGCDSVHTLNLTINYSTSTTTTSTACDSYTWAQNNVTYTTSGTYTAVGINASGCTETYTLNLTVNNGSTSSTAASACGSYTWVDNGTTYTASGVYTYTSMNASGCVNTATLNLTINYVSSSITTVTACNSYTWTNGVTYTAAGTYTYATLNSAGCDSVLTLVLTMTNGVKVSPKALLSGAYLGAGMMRDDLRTNGVLPTTEPYTALSGKFQPIGCSGYNGGETITPAMLAVTGNDAIVDWVHVEIRNTDAAYSKVATQNALIQRDGDIVDANGNPLTFNCVCTGNYYVVVKHRNHLGVMTATSLALTSTTTSVDFTKVAPVWTKPGIVNAARETNGAFRLLWPGDTRTDKNTKYNGLNNDKEPILYAVGIAIPNNILFPVYRTEDANMNAEVKYNNTNNDKNFILDKIGVANPNDVLLQHTPN